MDVDNQYTADVLKTLYHDKKYTDFEIRTGNKKVLCHRAVISAKSQYFDSICASGLREAVLDYASDEHGYVLEDVVKFMYLGETDSSEHNVEQLSLAADFIKHADLVSYCERFMIENLSLKNFTAYLKLANNTSLLSLRDACVRLTKEKCSDVLLTNWFLSLSVAEVCTYLKDELNVTSEDEVLTAVQRWLSSAKASQNVKEDYIQNVFPCIRLRFCSKSALESISIDETASPIMTSKILRHLYHGLHGEGSARKSYSPAHEATAAPTAHEATAALTAHEATAALTAHEATAAPTKGSSGPPVVPPRPSVSARAQSITRRKSPMAAPIASKPSAQEQVLIVGGLKANDIVHQNVVFVDKEGHDSILTEAPLCVQSCSCSVCTTGNGLIVSGGYNIAMERSVSKVQIFSLSNCSWRNLPDMSHPVDCHGVAYVDEHFYTFGGCNRKGSKVKRAYSSVNVLDLQSQSWSHCQSLPCTTAQSGVAVVGKDILVIGGYSENNIELTQTYKYNTETRKRTCCQDMPKFGQACQSTVAVDNLIYVLCRDMFLQYDVRADQWSQLPQPLPKDRRMARAMVHTQGCLRVFGGQCANSVQDSVLNYNFSSKKWTLEKKRMPVAVKQSWAFAVVM